LLYPIKRKGTNGEGKWEGISWDEAYDILTSKMKECKQKYGADPLSSVMGQVETMRRSFTDWLTFWVHPMCSRLDICVMNLTTTDEMVFLTNCTEHSQILKASAIPV
jgi:anaerobic selenocysteine-containing dehydrogenase